MNSSFHLFFCKVQISIYNSYKLISTISGYHSTVNLFFVCISEICQNLISCFFSVGTINPLEIFDICHNHMKLLVIFDTHQCLCMMKKCLADIKSRQLIVFQCRQNNRRFPKLDYTVDLSLHNPDIVRLPDKVNGTQFQTANLIFRAVTSCYYNYRNRRKHYIIPDSVQKLKSVTDWHTHIQKNCRNITVIFSQQLQSLFSVNRSHNFITVFQELCQKFPVQFIIFYYKKLSSGRWSAWFQN